MPASGVKLVFDEHFSTKLISFVASQYGLAHIQHVRSLGWSGKPDHEWMPLAIKAGFVIITADRNERTRGVTAADFRAMGARVIFFGEWWSHMSRWELAKWLVANLEMLTKDAAKLRAGACLLMLKNGRGRTLE